MLFTSWLAWGLLFSQNPQVTWLTLLYSCFALIGFADDWLSLKNKKNQGLTTKQKFMSQWGIAFLLLLGFHYFLTPLNGYQFFLYAFVIVGSSNATNLTDGLDGLLAGCSIITLTGFIWLATQLKISWLTDFGLVYLIILGIFYIFNRYPAKCFMGDTGSLAIGALFAGLAILINNVWVLLPLGAVYILETGSVILQVGIYKFTKKRIFLMAPLHHHFELMGMKEPYVVWLLYSIATLFGAILFML